MLSVRFRQPPIACAAEPKGPHPLRQRPFNPCAPLVELLARLGAEPRPRRLQGLILDTGVHREMAGHRFGAGTARPLGTGIAIPSPKFHGDLGGAVAIDLRRPGARDFPLGTEHLLVLPVYRKLLSMISACHLRLPTDIGSCGAD